MKRESIAGLCLYYAPEELEAARLIGAAWERTVQLLWDRGRLSPPADCRVYVMTSWSSFLFHSATWPWKVYLALTFPLVAYRAQGIWPSVLHLDMVDNSVTRLGRPKSGFVVNIGTDVGRTQPGLAFHLP